MENQSAQSKYDCLLFDLDDTLYPLSSGIAAACRKNIEEFMLQKLGIELSKVPDLASLLYKVYGTTMAGLRAIGYEFDYDEYHSFVHGRLPYQYLKPDPVLRGLLLSLPIRKVVFTNGDKIHAAKVLNRLGLNDCFEGIICFETLNKMEKSSQYVSVDEDAKPNVHLTEIYDIMEHFSTSHVDSDLPSTPVVCKPSEAAIEEALKIANINPHRTVNIEEALVLALLLLAVSLTPARSQAICWTGCGLSIGFCAPGCILKGATGHGGFIILPHLLRPLAYA